MEMVPRIKWFILCCIVGFLFESSSALSIAVIGAGASGLTSAKNALDQGHNVVIFEKSGVLGGVWWYTNETGLDEYGVFIHSPMYSGLRTNTPYETMEFVGHHFPDDTNIFPTSDVVWSYLYEYAEKFNVTKHIKYHHLVEEVHLNKRNKWQITVRDLPHNHTELSIFDAVFVCSGVCSSPHYPSYEGKFRGQILHSHEYRRPDNFKGKDVLVIGNGASGADIAEKLLGIAKSVTHSSRTPLYIDSDSEESSDKIISKGDVKCLTTNGVEFLDGTHQNFTVIIYATGYLYSYPFLSENTSIHTDNNYVRPLYKQILNIEHPTMAFVGIPYGGPHNMMAEIQARFALKFLSKAKKLPKRREMLKDAQIQLRKRLDKGIPEKKFHNLFANDEDGTGYLMDLKKTADI